jgi:HPt (histidine-containing phosphotransfer) domain-containing protein
MEDPADARPLLDYPTLARLLADLDGDHERWRAFIGAYLAQLPAWTQRVHDTLLVGDLDGATDAVLSLRASSPMAGATQLAFLAHDLQRSVNEARRFAEPAGTLRLLGSAKTEPVARCARLTAGQLESYLRRQQQHNQPTGLPA